MKPRHRTRIYLFFGALLALLVAFVLALDLYDALTTRQLDAWTGSRHYQIKEHFVYDEKPGDFILYFLQKAMFLMLTVVLGFVLLWEALTGQRVFKH